MFTFFIRKMKKKKSTDTNYKQPGKKPSEKH